ncbi:uncharacterized protein N7500_002695 [Penicillium coprophilum]|uniref:uncharacterized protein n=1 Tax=Penicillium coprophilum TaxID=36646 RepID=UPI0023894400|nr:uncharacterized protein N7500_002695 [Penicillium coprophilum]KAJ5169912.1 hypothetical protein N7500_002695 [Penicillium coprophilum]
MSSDTNQKGEDSENRFTLSSYNLKDIDLELWHREVKKFVKVEPPCWTRRDTRTQCRSVPKDPNLGPFPDLPPIVWTEDYWTRLWDRAILPEATRGYQMAQMYSSEKERCKQCRFAMWGPRRLQLLANESTIRQHEEDQARRARQAPDEPPKVGSYKEDIIDELTDECIGKIYWTEDMVAKWKKRQAAKEGKRAVKYGCWGHPGKPVGKWQFKDHKIVKDEEAWKINWELHEAPKFPVDYRYAVALDCEMGITDLGEQELLRISAIDYFTGEKLIDKLVFPKVRMWHTNYRFSGVNWEMLYAAKSRGEAFIGRDAAREALFRYVGPNTVLVVHGGRADMLALRIIHQRIVDTMLFAQASLKENAKEILNRNIQQGLGHDSLEDALACRDIADHFIKVLPFEHIYGPRYGQMWRSKVWSLAKPMKDGKIDPEWRPPSSKNRVPYLKSYRPFEPWVVQEERRRAENLPWYEQNAEEWYDQGWDYPGAPLEYLITPEVEKAWALVPRGESWSNPEWDEPEDKPTDNWQEPQDDCATNEWAPVPRDKTWSEPEWNEPEDGPTDDWHEPQHEPQNECGADDW